MSDQVSREVKREHVMDRLSCPVEIGKHGWSKPFFVLKFIPNYILKFAPRPHIAPIFQAVCAKVENGEPCCDWVGEDGSGHFVKMVHNGIEYGDMQLICEAYHIMKDILGMTHDEMAEKFDEWNKVRCPRFLQVICDQLKKT
jgi:hypothetical protein